jgi:trk system potassium uptake protein TrkH
MTRASPKGQFRWVPEWDDLLESRRPWLTSVRLVALSFVGLITVGTLGLLLLPGLYTKDALGFVDALFTATSAVCVTGLIVVDTATYFTPFGQAWVLLLIQLGGVGILTVGTFVVLGLTGRTRLRSEEAAAGGSTALRLRPRVLLMWVVALTLAVETIGAFVLWGLWVPQLGAAGAAWHAVFHAISAFCNAGFSTFSESLAGFRRQPASLLVVALLIVLGGLGFLVFADIGRWLRLRRPLTLHSRLTLFATGVLILGAWVAYLSIESGITLRALGWGDRVTNALFMAVTARTAGFNTIDYNAIAGPTVVLTGILMAIGGSPASTAGGLKTTTAALLILLLFSRVRGQQHVSVFGRTVPAETVNRSAGMAVGGIVILLGMVFLLLMAEQGIHDVDRNHLIRVGFEATSAFGTVGLSMGVTGALSAGARLLLTALMFVGRVGPLTLATAMAVSSARGTAYRYAHEDVVIG